METTIPIVILPLPLTLQKSFGTNATWWPFCVFMVRLCKGKGLKIQNFIFETFIKVKHLQIPILDALLLVVQVRVPSLQVVLLWYYAVFLRFWRLKYVLFQFVPCVRKVISKTQLYLGMLTVEFCQPYIAI